MSRQITVVTDLGYGDAGKGTIVDYLVRQTDSAVVVRHNGGAQAAHNVVTPDGRHHTFAQFGSGSFVPGVKTHLSRFMLVNPPYMEAESLHLMQLGLTDIWQRTSIDSDAKLITLWHVAVNQLRELARGNGRHGSCGHGIGETMADSIAHPELTVRAGDTLSLELPDKLQAVYEHKLAQAKELADQIGPKARELMHFYFKPSILPRITEAYWRFSGKAIIVPGDYLGFLVDAADQTVFEGAQGVLLDEWNGFHPYTTWSKTTHQNALTMIDELSTDAPVTQLGVTRSYMTRHGAGPFVTEDTELVPFLPDEHNGTNDWQQHFRVGYPDMVALRYAVRVSGGIDELAVTHMDRAGFVTKYANRYRTGKAVDPSLFELDSNADIQGIIPGVGRQLERQGAITAQITASEPVYQPVSTARFTSQDHRNQLLDVFTDQLGAPVTIVSSGKTWADKQALVIR